MRDEDLDQLIEATQASCEECYICLPNNLMEMESDCLIDCLKRNREQSINILMNQSNKQSNRLMLKEHVVWTEMHVATNVCDDQSERLID